MRSRLGECLVASGLIDARDLRKAIAEHERTGDRLGTVLTRMRLASEEQIAQALAAQLGFPYVDLTERPLDPAIVRIIPRELAVRAACIAMDREDEAVVVAMADPLLFSLIQELEGHVGSRIKEVVATQSAILTAIETVYPEPADVADGDAASDAAARGIRGETPDAGAASPDRAVESLLRMLADAEQSEVHLEPTADALLVRARQDGALVTVLSLPMAGHEEITARLKLLAGLDVSERLLPQAGRLQAGQEAPVAVRLSTLRTEYGEKVVIRPIDRRKPALPLVDLGLSPIGQTMLHEALQPGGGVVVVAGPRGSGRTTTLASVLASLASHGASVASIAPITEYLIEGVTPIATEAAVGLTPATAVAGAIAQNAEVVAIDDLQDPDAAAAAARAAAAGCTVIVSVGAEDAADAAVALTLLAPDRELLVGRLRGVLAQRLVRRLCPACRRVHTPSPEDLRTLDLASGDSLAAPIYQPAGCDMCGFGGYRGRIGVFEVMRITDELRRLLRSGAAALELRAAARASGMVSLADEARARLESGVTSLTELRHAVLEPRGARSVCAQCGSGASPEYSACPHCGASLGGVCAHCGRALQRGWTFCPFCARIADQGARPPKRGIMRLVRNPERPDTV